MVRILYGDIGDVRDPRSSSGSGYPCYNALKEFADPVGSIDASFGKLGKYLNALLTFHPDFVTWREHRHKSIGTLMRQSKVAADKERAFTGQYDFYLQQRALISPVKWCKVPYGIYTDATHANTLESWPEWSPFSERECQEWLKKERDIYDHATLLFPRSQYVADSMINDYGQDPAKVHVVGAGINFDSAPQMHGDYDGKTLLFIGYDFKRKGGYDVLAAFEKVQESIPDARLLVAGPSRLVDADGVHFLGKLKSREEILDLYRRASLFVMPSHFEPWGNVYLEAMANGVPCIAADWGAGPEIVSHEKDGWLVPRGDQEELAKTLIHALSDASRLAVMGTVARDKVLNEYRWDQVAQRMVTEIEKVILS